MTIALPQREIATLTPDQRAIVEAPDGPMVVIAGAGTGKTRVIVERVRWLLETKGVGRLDADGRLIPAEAITRDKPFDGPLQPEQILVLTYNVKAARELAIRLDTLLSPTVRARLPVSNFHSFCHGILTAEAAEAGLRTNPDVLDSIGQILLLRDIRPSLGLVYHGGQSNTNWWLEGFVGFINRAKDELVTPDDFDAYVERERLAFEKRFGSYEDALIRVERLGYLGPAGVVRRDYAAFRARERAADRDDAAADPNFDTVHKTADREARRAVGGTGKAIARWHFGAVEQAQIDRLADSYVPDAAALEILRLQELSLVYHSYQAKIRRRGVLDFGEQIAKVTELFKERPNVLRRYQRQYRYILVDEFQDANIAQIELIELLGRTPDRPDNVMVVGDDDQSIYRFRGASFAAFEEFNRRFSGPPVHDPDGPAPGFPPVRRIEQNFRSVDNVLRAANRLISNNEMRFEPDKRLHTDREAGAPVELVVSSGAEDEAVAIVEAIKSLIRPELLEPGMKPAWSDVAVLYRKHKHREAIVARLRDEDIPYTVVGGLSLLDTPEIRDLEQSLRVIADPNQSVALVRMLSAAPWRLDALELLQLTRMAAFDRRPLVDTIRQIVATGEVEVDRPSATEDGVGEMPTTPAESVADTRHRSRRDHASEPVQPDTRAKLRRVIEALEELTPMTWRAGPLTILERLLERTSRVLDLIATDSLEAMRTVANIGSFLRFANDWQTEHPDGHLAGFVAYLDAYQTSGGELPTSVELTEELEGVRLMTVYQAKGLEFRHVFVPRLIGGEWPTGNRGGGMFPTDLLREAVPPGDFQTEEERRLLYVAMTRAQDTLVLTTHPVAKDIKGPSIFVGEILNGAGTELLQVDRTSRAANLAPVPAPDEESSDQAVDSGLERTAALVRRVMPLPTKREQRLALRLRATELVSLLESIDSNDPEAAAARERFSRDLARVGETAALDANEALARGLDPLTLRVITLDTAAGANLLDVAALPGHFSFSAFNTYDRCPAMYAFRDVYRIPTSRTAAAASFGTAAHAAFEAFTKEYRARVARGETPPGRDDLTKFLEAEWKPTEFGDRTVEQTFERRVGTLLHNFYTGELSTLGQAELEEQWFDLTLEPGDGSPPIVVHGSIDRIDRLPSGGIEVIDYKTGRAAAPKSVEDSLQLSIYAHACRDTLGLGTPEKVTLYYTESATRLSATRTDEQLDGARADILARVARIRSGDFAATPSLRVCGWCDYAEMCPSRMS